MEWKQRTSTASSRGRFWTDSSEVWPLKWVLLLSSEFKNNNESALVHYQVRWDIVMNFKSNRGGSVYSSTQKQLTPTKILSCAFIARIFAATNFWDIFLIEPQAVSSTILALLTMAFIAAVLTRGSWSLKWSPIIFWTSLAAWLSASFATPFSTGPRQPINWRHLFLTPWEESVRCYEIREKNRYNWIWIVLLSLQKNYS